MSLATPVFFISSGRSGSAMMERLFNGVAGIEAHHEYLCTHVQSIACLWEMQQITRDEACRRLDEIYRPALRYCRQPVFLDSSNKLSWVIELLAELFPKARFVHLVRDGRKVTSSFYHKLAEECYDDYSVTVLRQAVYDGLPLPPPEKKYYWPQPCPSDPEAARFTELDQFGRICWHWGRINRRIEEQLATLDSSRQFFCRLEDLTSNGDIVAAMFKFIGANYDSALFVKLQRPFNVNIPRDELLTESQLVVLRELAGDVMERYGYTNTPEYRMSYERKI